MIVPKEGNNGLGRVEDDGTLQCLQLLWTECALYLDSVLFFAYRSLTRMAQYMVKEEA